MSQVNTYIEALGMTVEELCTLSETERQSLYVSFYEEYGSEGGQYKALVDSIADLEGKLDLLIDEMDDIVDDNDSSVEDISRAENELEDLEAMLDIVDDFSSDYATAKSDADAHDVDATDGSDKTLTPGTDVAEGEEFVVDASTTAIADEKLFEDPHAEDSGHWVDTDGDGYTDTLADENDDGVADHDTNGANIVDETDMLDAGSTDAPQTITIALSDGESVALASYSADTGDTRWKITTKDGITYYITVKGAPDIRWNGAYTLNTAGIASAWAPELLHRTFESSTITNSFGDILEVEDPNATTEGFYTIYDMADQANFTAAIEPAAADYENGRTYDIYCSTSIDTINLDFGDNVTLSFSEGDAGALIITATDANGDSITVTIHDWDDHLVGTTEEEDKINILSGNLCSDYLDQMAKIYMGDEDSDAHSEAGWISHYIFLYGSSTSVYDQAEATGYDWTEAYNA